MIGYYGQGNFGDDVLMVVAHLLVQQILPGAGIALRIGGTSTYHRRLLGSRVEQLPFGTRDEHKLVVHGGGGTYFDFMPHSFQKRAINALMLSAGAEFYVKGEGNLRKIVGRPRLSARTRLGFGLGIGTFSSGSRKLLEALPVLADFDALWLRDADSIRNLKKTGVSPTAFLGSDLAFLWDAWCPAKLALSRAKSKAARPRVGVILRDWVLSSDEELAQSIGPAIELLKEYFDFLLISFDPSTDTRTLELLPDMPRLLWRPEESDIATFVELLATQDALLTARAHGAICGACLGRPSVILNIEPKLQAVHDMLPSSTRLISPLSSADVLHSKIQEVLEISSDQIIDDVLYNRSLSEVALASTLQEVNI